MPRPLPRSLRGAAEGRGAAETPAPRPSPRPSPRPRPTSPAEAEHVPSAGSPEARWRSPLRPLGRRGLTALAGSALALAVVAGVLGWQDIRAGQTAQASGEALRAARTGAETLFSYDYRSIGSDLTEGRKVVTGQLATDYADTSALVEPQAVANRAIVDATVSEAAVVSATPDRVVVLLYLNQATQNKNVSGTRMDLNRVRLTMVPVDGNWRIARAEPL
jgi:Mce-associated membrane protein